MTAWRRAEARLWEQVEDRRWLEFWRLASRARKEWAELHKRQEDALTEARPGEPHPTGPTPGSGGSSARYAEFVGAVPGRVDLVEGWREHLDRYHKRERAALGKTHGDSARQIERRVREGLPKRATQRGAARETKEHKGTWGRERGPSIIISIPRPRRPRDPERGGGGFER